ncbi:MAG: leukocyte elastase inhibitor-like [Chlorobi bacterium]|jgi:serine protease inhibitor|nr:leukocyte elastase inhibitor-like [Chlorobiota bacterium]
MNLPEILPHPFEEMFSGESSRGASGVEYGVDLSNALAAMGLGDLFSTEQIDLSGIGGAPGELAVGSVVHKTFLDVHEEGTEAAAVTMMMGRGIPSLPPSLVFDRPFLLLIRERVSVAVLMAGAISDPG